MAYFRKLVFVAALAGLVAGLVMTALQFTATVPLITAAEVYETADAAGDAHAAHHADAEPWAPADGVERMAYTALANMITAIGFSLVLTVVSEIAGGVRTLWQGVAWGAAGFAVFLLAPGLGLPPELPGMPAAELEARQFWWIATVLATAGGLALAVWGRTPLTLGAAVALVVLPHLAGAPQPAEHASDVPGDLWQRFVVAVAITNLIFWGVLGVSIGFFNTRLKNA